MKDISVQEFSQKLKENTDIVILDVRENYEYELGHLDCLHIPMADIPLQASSLDCKKETYVLCKTGKRAAAVANYLATNFNFSNIFVVIGGVETYANEIDQSIQV